ncbi:hypothetical protein WJX72_006546 [[Myrmecia] bisecta]|uniref:Uncharacterized protein n=1 Tax=[Myrmecia] bisecta TaxID=41462 RepID=A0AAW1P3D2_9CHLO
MALVPYDSDSGSGKKEVDKGGSDSEDADSYFVGSDSESEDDATRRRREAEERLRDSEAETTGRGLALPAAADVLAQSSGPPKYLDPEATRPLASYALHGLGRPPAGSGGASAASTTGPTEPKAWDIASMAPPLKGQKDSDKRGLPEGAVISAAAKRYKTDDRVSSSVVTAAQVAMLGGQWRPTAEADADGKQDMIGPSAHPQAKQPAAKATRAMSVSEFLDKGVGGAQLPRSKQDRKEKEKLKRGREQSSVHGWKSEAEMVLRQQYD